MPNRGLADGDVLRVTLDLIVLQTLDTLGDLHDTRLPLASKLRRRTQLNPAMLSAALMRLEQRGLVRGNWDSTDSNPKARFDTLTATGRRQLVNERLAWDGMAAIFRTP